MTDIHSALLRVLSLHEWKPGELAEKLGVTRQTLHKYLRELVAAKKVQKSGEGPHVVYFAIVGADETRISKDYALCEKDLLPRYVEDFSRSLTQYMERSGKISTGTKGKIDLGFLLDSAAVYSSNIEGNTLDLNSFLNSRMAPKKHRPKEAQEIEDLVSAYVYARKNDLDEKHMLHAHGMLSRQFVAKSRQGTYRREPVGVFSRSGLVYMAAEPHLVPQEMRALFAVVQKLLEKQKSPAECFFWAEWLHLMIALIHPFADGNGRTARLCEKWFLLSVLGDRAFSVPSEELYWQNRPQYYAALKLGVNYWETDFGKAAPFFALLPEALLQQKED